MTLGDIAMGIFDIITFRIIQVLKLLHHFKVTEFDDDATWVKHFKREDLKWRGLYSTSRHEGFYIYIPEK